MDKNETAAINARFVGDPADDFSGKSNVTMFGVDFEKGEFTRVEDPDAIRKIRGHSHFEVEGEGEVKKKTVETDELPPLDLEALKEVARDEGVEFEDDTTKPKLMKAIRAKRKANAKAD